jgi:protein-tyrosine kinase
MGDADRTAFMHLKEYPNLWVITTGPIPPNSSELLGSTQMKHLMDLLREEYDVIIMDTPPILPVTDAVVASSLADGVILVVEAGKTRNGEVHHAQEVLHAAHANLLGVVLNRARLHINSYYTGTYSASSAQPAKPQEAPPGG